MEAKQTPTQAHLGEKGPWGVPGWHQTHTPAGSLTEVKTLYCSY